jgi:bifunctional DNA-binding transcriptional regulator/antitoxin component of YhaV-PrlF toxin-antitoxin module
VTSLLKVDPTGAVTLPAESCQAAGVAPGSDLLVEIQGSRIVLQPPQPTLAERIVTRANSLPPDALDGLPDDLASQHDHYLYGTPRRPE